MKKFLILVAAMTALGSFGASAQDIGVRIGPNGVRIGAEPTRERVIVRERRGPDRVIVRERRGRVEARGRGRCETVTTRRTNRFGRTVVTRERRC